jgi:hypothetical protein
MKKNPSRQTRAFFQEQHHDKRNTVPTKICAFIVAAPADFFNPKNHKFAWKGLK